MSRPSNPFRGLAPYTHSDAPKFDSPDLPASIRPRFELEPLLYSVLATRTLVVYGPAGSGKTSLFGADVLPCLAERFRCRTVEVLRWPAPPTNRTQWAHALALAMAVQLDLNFRPAADAAPLDELELLLLHAERRSDWPIIVHLDHLERLLNRDCAEAFAELARCLVWLAQVQPLHMGGVHIVMTVREESLGLLRESIRWLPWPDLQDERLPSMTVAALTERITALAALAGRARTWPEASVRSLVGRFAGIDSTVGDDAPVDAAIVQVVCAALWQAESIADPMPQSPTDVFVHEPSVVLEKSADALLRGLNREPANAWEAASVLDFLDRASTARSRARELAEGPDETELERRSAGAPSAIQRISEQLQESADKTNRLDTGLAAVGESLASVHARLAETNGITSTLAAVQRELVTVKAQQHQAESAQESRQAKLLQEQERSTGMLSHQQAELLRHNQELAARQDGTAGVLAETKRELGTLKDQHAQAELAQEKRQADLLQEQRRSSGELSQQQAELLRRNQELAARQDRTLLAVEVAEKKLGVLTEQQGQATQVAEQHGELLAKQAVSLAELTEKQRNAETQIGKIETQLDALSKRHGTLADAQLLNSTGQRRWARISFVALIAVSLLILLLWRQSRSSSDRTTALGNQLLSEQNKLYAQVQSLPKPVVMTDLDRFEARQTKQLNDLEERLAVQIALEHSSTVRVSQSTKLLPNEFSAIMRTLSPHVTALTELRRPDGDPECQRPLCRHLVEELAHDLRLLKGYKGPVNSEQKTDLQRWDSQFADFLRQHNIKLKK